MGSTLQPLATPPDLKLLIARAVDEQFMLAIFQRELSLMSSADIHITACTAQAGKARSTLKKTNVQVAYHLTIEVDGSEKQRRVLLGTLPVTPDFLSPELLECCRAANGHPEVRPFDRLAAFIPELQMGVQFFPVDIGLPALLEATARDSGQLIAPFIPEARDGATIEQTRAELVQYKPGKRCVLRFTARLSCPGRDACERVVLGKIFANDRGAAIHRDMQALWHVSRRSRCLRVPEPLGYDPEHRMLVMTEATGERDLNLWLNCLEKGKPLPPGVDLCRLERCMTVVAEALAELHRSEIHPRKKRTFRSELADAQKNAELVRQAPPELAREIGRLLKHLQIHALDNEPLVPSHGGFRHKQLMGNDRCLTLLDWDSLTLANPALDAASFVCRLRHAPIRQPRKHPELEQLAQLFRREFFAREPEVNPRHVELYEALVLADGLLRALRRPKRVDKVVSTVHHLLAETERLLNGKGSLV